MSTQQTAKIYIPKELKAYWVAMANKEGMKLEAWMVSKLGEPNSHKKPENSDTTH